MLDIPGVDASALAEEASDLIGKHFEAHRNLDIDAEDLAALMVDSHGQPKPGALEVARMVLEAWKKRVDPAALEAEDKRAAILAADETGIAHEASCRIADHWAAHKNLDIDVEEMASRIVDARGNPRRGAGAIVQVCAGRDMLGNRDRIILVGVRGWGVSEGPETTK